MKKILFVLVLLSPLMVEASPSVRLLGNSSNITSAGGTKVSASNKSDTTSIVTSKSTNMGRAGSLKTQKISGSKIGNITTSGNSTSNSSRFPVITPVKNYSSITSQGTSTVSSVDMSEVETKIDEKADSIIQNVSDNYYNKTDINAKIENINKNLDSIPSCSSVTNTNSIDANRVPICVE